MNRKVDSKISSLYYVVDCTYNINIMKKSLDNNYIVILNRYVESNMAFHERDMMYEWLDNLEFVLLDLPRPDMVLFLYLPYEVC